MSPRRAITRAKRDPALATAPYGRTRPTDCSVGAPSSGCRSGVMGGRSGRAFPLRADKRLDEKRRLPGVGCGSAKRRLLFAQSAADGQLQTPQRPTLQEHAGGRRPTCRGFQRRTHSSAEGSVRSTAPPGQQTRRIADTSRAVSGSARAEIDSMCAAIRRSRGSSAIRHADTPRGGGRHMRILPAADMRTRIQRQVVWGTRATLSW